MTIAENDALKALLMSNSDLALAGKVFEGRAVGADGKPITGSWYITIQAGADDDSQERITGPYVKRRPSYTFQCSGSKPQQAQFASELVDSVLRPFGRGVRLSVPGVRTSSLRRDYVGAVQIDSDVSPPMWFQTVEYSFDAQPAPSN